MTEKNWYPRDMRGYGSTPPKILWPNEACLAVQIVVNYEEGGERCLLHGDQASEAFLSEIVGADAWPSQRHWNMESIYEYGARAGFWRLRRILDDRGVPATVFAVATALARSPSQTKAMQDSGWEIASHGLKWIEYKDFSKAEESEYMEAAVRLHQDVTGELPQGWYTGRCSMHTFELAAKRGHFAYISDSYADDLPYWVRVDGRDQLVIPYTLDVNDMRFATVQGFNSGSQFFDYLKDSFDLLYEEGQAGTPKMMSIGLHCRLAGRPGRAMALRRFIKYAQEKSGVWFARRIDIARHFAKHYPPPKQLPWWNSKVTKEMFIKQYGAVFEHSPWVASRSFDLEFGPAHDCAEGIHSLLCQAFRQASDDEKMDVLMAHPELAGKLAEAKRLTSESASEQASAGLDALTDEERSEFEALNNRYRRRFHFPFIIAVRDHTRQTILDSFRRRVDNNEEEEFNEACRQVERIAWYRLVAIFEKEPEK